MNPVIAERRLKNMTAWDRDPKLCQEDIDALLLAARRLDAGGLHWDTDGWIPTYHLEWAAREAWAWKAGFAAERYQIIGDGVTLSRQQTYEHCRKMQDLYAKLASNRPYSIRSHGNLAEDQTGTYSTIPWWYSLVAN